jgi:hypothetical protein
MEATDLTVPVEDIYEPNDYSEADITANIVMDSSLVIKDVTMAGMDVDR